LSFGLRRVQILDERGAGDARRLWLARRLAGGVAWLVTNIDGLVSVSHLVPSPVAAACYEHRSQQVPAQWSSDGTEIARWRHSQGMGGHMLATFDFPSALNASRTIRHAAGVATCHVAGNSCYCPGIKPAWRPPPAEGFAAAWQTRADDTIRPPKRAKTSTGTAATTSVSWTDSRSLSGSGQT
jgi:hypothetical protein